jgi:hypothetical protein
MNKIAEHKKKMVHAYLCVDTVVEFDVVISSSTISYSLGRCVQCTYTVHAVVEHLAQKGTGVWGPPRL